jgi:hypothetical protein
LVLVETSSNVNGHKHESFAMDMSMAHVIAIGEDGIMRGGADPRAGGGVAYSS